MKPLVAIHPFLLALFPTLLLYSQNSHQFYFEVIYVPIVVTLALTALVQLVLAGIFRKWDQAALLTSFLLLMFFSFGHLARALSMDRGILLLIWVPVLVGGVILLIRTKRELRTVTTILNCSTAFLVLLPSAIILAALLSRSPAQNDDRNAPDSPAGIALQAPARQPPDIYYIILDGYARADVLLETYKTDNAAFTGYLEEKGFYLARASRANYIQTALSLASALNLDYIDKMLPAEQRRGRNRGPLAGLLRNSRLATALKSQGYRLVAFSSGYFATELDNFDTYLKPAGMLGEFGSGLLGATPVPAVLDFLTGSHTEFDAHRRRINYTLEHLEDTRSLRGPLFVFAHILCPHPPFVFDSNGEPLTPTGEYGHGDGNHLIREGGLTRREYLEKYIGQVEYLNKRLVKTIDALIDESHSEPVVILQADHGPGLMLTWGDPQKTYLKERLGILNAYYLPGEGRRHLYPSISPVNTFRVILNHYFQAELPLLQDRSYFSAWTDPFTLIDVTQQATATERRGTTLHGLWGSNANDVWIVGVQGTIGHWDGRAWKTVASGTQANLNAVGGSSSVDAWAVGDSGTVLHWDKSAWSSLPAPASHNLSGVWSLSATDVWMVGAAGTILHFDGESLSPVASGTSRNLNAVWGSSADNLWAVGAAGLVLHWTGEAFGKVASGTTDDLQAVWGFSAEDVWTVGTGGRILHWDGKAFSAVPSGTDRKLLGVWGAAPEVMWAVGEEGTLLRWDSKSWSKSPIATVHHLRAVWGAAAQDVWAVGELGTMIHRK